LNTSNYMETPSEMPKLRSRLGKRQIIRIMPADQSEVLEILVNASVLRRWLKTSPTTTWTSPSTAFSLRLRLQPNLIRHRPANQKRNPRTPRGVRISPKAFLVEGQVVVGVDADADVLVVVVVHGDVVEVAVVGRRLRQMRLMLERSSLRIPKTL